MIVTDPMSMELSDAGILLTFGSLAIFFTFMPMLIILMRQFEKFGSNEAKEHVSGRSNIDYIISSTIILSISYLTFFFIVGIFNIVFPDWGQITGGGGIIQKFWTMKASGLDGDLEYERRAIISMMQAIQIIGMFAKTMCFVLVAAIMILSVQISNSIVSNYSDDTQTNTIMGVATKTIVTLTISWFSVIFYNEATKSIFNHPNGGVYDVFKTYVLEALLEFGKGVITQKVEWH